MTTAKGFKDLSECCKVGHDKLKLYQHNGKYKMTGLNHCHKPCCVHCLPILLYRQQMLINQAVEYCKDHDLKVSLWTLNLPRQNQSLLFTRKKLHYVTTDFLRLTTRNSKERPINKVLKKINQITGSVGYIYRNEVSTTVESKFNPQMHLLDIRKNSLTSEQMQMLKASLIEICKKNKVYFSKKQESKLDEVILDFKVLNFKEEQNSYNYLTKIADNDAIQLANSNEELYKEYCTSQIILNSKENSENLKIPLIYWQPGLKRKLGIKEKKFQIEESIEVPDVIVNFVKFNHIKPKKIIEIVNTVGDAEILNNENIFSLLQN